jgi:hypothetical protein
MYNTNEKMLLSSSKEESGWNEWAISQASMTDGRDTADENKEPNDNEKKQDYYLEWT